MAKVGKYTFLIQRNEIDFSSQATLASLADYLLLCAGNNAAENGFSMEKLQENGRAWVLSRFEMRFEKRPKSNETITIETWVERVEKRTTERRFFVYDSQGHLIGKAASTWVIINFNTRKIIDLSIEPLLKQMVLQRDDTQKAPEKIEILNTTLIDSHRVTYSDIDINLHVNSIKYMQMVIDTIPLERHKQCDIKGFSVNYVNETKYGDTLTIEKEIGDREAFLLQRNDKKTACKLLLYE